MKTTDLKKTLKEFRHALGKTQTEFAQLLGKALPTVQRYEAVAAPKGRVLAELEEMAHEHGLEDYACAFGFALSAEIGWSRPQRMLTNNPHRRHPRETLAAVYDELFRDTIRDGLTVTAIRLEFDQSNGTTRFADIELPSEQSKAAAKAWIEKQEKRPERPRSNPRLSEKKK
jgi:transcriptional regulator with XRE-family HTH domain